eukprot:TRINITY_DN4749_c0_g1_i1.p1 TRINITY_DN4749_c0_g1~~TRINITY_DN4749_c0_g1_i1.p1  ORF type:complete len:533 (+),score=143.97 TRINITY_DN4749_c0_g1_i1:32-1630(+)
MATLESIRVSFKDFPPIIQPSDLPAFKVELGNPSSNVRNTPRLAIPDDVFARDFYNQRLYHFIGTKSREGKEEEENTILSVFQIPESSGKHKALVTDKKGCYELAFSEQELSETGKKTVPERIIKHVSEFLNGTWYQVLDPKFSEEVVQVEKKHPQDNKKCFKIGIVYATEDQTSPKDMFANKSPSKDFLDFLNILGRKIQLDTWDGYRGDLGRTGEAYYTQWNDFQFIFHVAPMMDSDQIRRLIGNDLAIVIYQEGPSFNPSKIDEFGTVTQIFGVVKKESQLHRMGWLSRINIKSYGPEIPTQPLTNTELRDFLLTKLANGYIMTMMCPPMNRLFFTPRLDTIAALAAAFPPETEKDQRTREKIEIQKRNKLRNSLVTNTPEMFVEALEVKVISGKGLAVKDINGSSDPYCELAIKEQKFKTKIIKKSLNPTWGEEFTFNLIGIDRKYTDLQVTVWDWDRFSTPDFMGQIRLPLISIDKYLDKDSWFVLETNENNEKVAGAICLAFRVVEATIVETVRRASVAQGKRFST